MNKIYNGQKIEWNGQGWYILGGRAGGWSWTKAETIEEMNSAGRFGLEVSYLEEADTIQEEEQGIPAGKGMDNPARREIFREGHLRILSIYDRKYLAQKKDRFGKFQTVGIFHNEAEAREALNG